MADGVESEWWVVSGSPEGVKRELDVLYNHDALMQTGDGEPIMRLSASGGGSRLTVLALCLSDRLRAAIGDHRLSRAG